MKKYMMIITGALLVSLLAGASGCGNSVAYNDYLDDTAGYDKQLFYENIGDIQAADPDVITVGNTFYLYATSADADQSCVCVRAWRSGNLSDWEALGPVFVPARDAWAVNAIWAPEVVEKDGMYYLYYCGFDVAEEEMGIGIAVSASPAGPFHELEGEFGGISRSRTVKPFDFGYPAIDPHPFLDEDGSVYLYFSRDQVSRESSVMACKLKADMVTVEEGTLTEEPLIRPSQPWENPQTSPRWNEAPFVFKRNGKYYLTYSANYFRNAAYAVGVAVSDHPLSGFRKVEDNPILSADPDWNFVSGTGHDSIFPSPDGTELWMAYHSHIDVDYGGSERKINFDRIAFDGERMYVCGPSTTPQVLPSGCSEYENLAGEAMLSDDAANLLVDGIINYDPDACDISEYLFEKSGTIELTFPEPVSVKAIMVYDSADYELSAQKIDIKLDGGSISGLKFNPKNRYVDEFGYTVKVPGSAAIAEFEERVTSKITMKVSRGTSVSEVVVLGRKTAS